jgi:hypothetical protein
MKTLFGKMGLVVAVTGVLLLSSPVRLLAQDDGGRDDWSRMERRERQIQRMPAPQQPTAPACATCPVVRRCPVGKLLGPLFLVLAIIHVMLAVWVFTDIRKRGEGSGIFIVLALLAGIPGTILYALVRIGDRVGEKKG